MVLYALLACAPQLTATHEVVVPEEVVGPPSALVGLTPADGELHLYDRGRTPGVNSGLEISNDGLWAHAGMKGFTCDVYTEDGSVAADLDYPGSGDEVIDGYNNRLLVRTNEGLFVTRFGQHTPSGSLDEEFLADARLVDGGLATLAWEEEGCRIAWYTQVDSPDARTFLDEGWCLGSVTMLAERDTGTVWLANSEQLVAITPQGEHNFAVGGDLLTWDPVWGQIYMAHSGDSFYVAIDDSGGWREIETAGPIRALGTLGQVGALVVGSPGGIEVIWGETGQVWGSYAGMIDAEKLIKSSESGAVLGVQEGTAARFFLVEVH
jgi:hypothetical protein